MRSIPIALLLLAASAAAAPAPAQSPAASTAARVLAAAETIDPPRIDGRLDEAAWADAEPAIGFVQLQPAPGAPASERTEARVLYDGEALYVALRMYDAAPDSIVAQLARRDQDVYSDWAYVFIDSYRDRRTAFGFGINAAGVQRDLKLTDDDDADDSWDAVWAGAARIDSLGWTAELRIPYSQLRFGGRTATADGPADADGGADAPAAAGAVFGLNFERAIARRDERAHWAALQPNSGAIVSAFGELRGLAAVEPPRRIELLPYTLGRVTRAPGDAGDPYWSQNAVFGSAGADLRLGLGSALTLSTTLNPDFGQVEADPSVVNLSAYPTFYDERRPFFVEGAELFRASGPRVFYSRRIGAQPQAGAPGDARYRESPENATILGAAKLSGKTAGGWSIGVLDAVTADERVRYRDTAGAEHEAVVEPLANYGVMRVAREFRQGRSSIGGILTTTHRRLDDPRLSFLRSAAYVAGADARHRFGGDRYELSGSITGSRIVGDTLAIQRVQLGPGHYYQRPDADHLEYDAARTSLSGVAAGASLARVAGGNWRWSATVGTTTPGFEINDLGFGFSNDRRYESLAAAYQDFTPHGAVRRWSVSAQQYGAWTMGGERIDVNGTLDAAAEWTNGWGLELWGMRHEGGTSPDALRGGPGLRNPGYYMGSISGYTDRRKSVVAHASVYWETERGTDGTAVHAMTGVELRPSPRSTLSLGPTLGLNTSASQYVARQSLGGVPHYVLGRLEQATASLSLRLDYTFSPTLSFQLYAEPFVSAGRYDRFMTVAQPLAGDFDQRFRVYAPDEIHAASLENGTQVYYVDGDGDGTEDFYIVKPDFNIRALRSNAVLRWEYRPGSTLFLVWSQDRSGRGPDGSFRFGRDVRGLLDTTGPNVLMLKASYWLGL